MDEELRPGMRGRLVSIVFGVGLAVQFGVPAWKLLQPRPQRLGWQMYSVFRPAPELVAVDAAGAESPLDHAAFLAVDRAELPPEAWRALPAHVCAVRGDVATVRHRLDPSGPWEAHPCR